MQKLRRVSILSSIRDELSGKCIDSFTKELDNCALGIDYEIREFIPGCINEAMTASYVQQAVAWESDVLFCVGVVSTKIAQEITSQHHRKTPIVFCATGDPVEFNFVDSLQSSGNHLTGVEMDDHQPLLPAQILLRVKPDMKKILLPYCPDARGGRIQYDALKLRDYFVMHSVDVVMLPITSREMLYDEISQKIHGVDALLFLEGDILREDADQCVVDLCNKHGVTLFGESIKGAVFGLAVDVAFMGAKAAEYVKKIVNENVHPSDLPIAMVENTRKIVFDKDNAKLQGVALSDDLLASIENNYFYRENIFYKTAYLLPEIAFNLNMMRGVASRMYELEGTEAYYHPNMYYTAPYSEVETFMSRHAIDNAFERGNVSIVATNELLTDMAIERREKEGKVKSMPIVALTNGNLEPECAAEFLNKEYTEQVDNIIRIVIPPTDPIIPLEAALTLKPTIKKVLVISFGNKDFSSLKAWADEQGVMLDIVQSNDLLYISDESEKRASSIDAIMYYEEHSHLSIAQRSQGLAKQYNIPLIAGGVEFGPQGAVISYGFDTQAIGRKLVELQRKHLHRKEEIDKKNNVIVLDGLDYLTVNESACAEQNLRLSRSMRMMLKREALIGQAKVLATKNEEEGDKELMKEAVDKMRKGGAHVTTI